MRHHKRLCSNKGADVYKARRRAPVSEEAKFTATFIRTDGDVVNRSVDRIATTVTEVRDSSKHLLTTGKCRNLEKSQVIR